MQISEDFIGDGCGKKMGYEICGGWSLKHDEHYYCDDCYRKLKGKRKETRLTVVYGDKRVFEKYDVEIEESIQDDGRTLKLFVKDSSDVQEASKIKEVGDNE